MGYHVIRRSYDLRKIPYPVLIISYGVKRLYLRQLKLLLK
jgi:hypothetical protein